MHVISVCMHEVVGYGLLYSNLYTVALGHHMRGHMKFSDDILGRTMLCLVQET